MSEPAPGGHGPDEHRGTGDPGAWSAATDPVSKHSASEKPGSDEPGREVPDEALPGSQVPRSQRPGSSQAGGSQPGGAPALSRGAGRPVGRAASGQARSRRPDSPGGGDLLTGLQRWLIRSSAKSMRREIEGQVRRTLGGGRAEPGDVWGTATTEPPRDSGESPECAWCPICRAARRMRESGPGLGSQISGASDVVAAAVQDAVVAFDAVLSRTPAAPGQQPPPADESPGSGHADSAGGQAERAADEPGDRG